MAGYKTYKTKPFRIQAVEFTGDNFDEVLEFVGFRYPERDVQVPNFAPAGTYVRWEDPEIVGEVFDYLHSTWVGVKAGQFIIRGSKAEYYPCDADIFHDKYEEDDEGMDEDSAVNIIINNCVDPERVAAEVIKQLRTRRRRGDRPAR